MRCCSKGCGASTRAGPSWQLSRSSIVDRHSQCDRHAGEPERAIRVRIETDAERAAHAEGEHLRRSEPERGLCDCIESGPTDRVRLEREALDRGETDGRVHEVARTTDSCANAGIERGERRADE